MLFNCEIALMMSAAESGFKLKSKTDKLKKSFVVEPYEIPEHLKQTEHES